MTTLLEPNSIPTPVGLATKLKSLLGLRASDGAMLIQQIHYWTLKEAGRVVDGVRWIYNTYDQWLEQFPWWSKWDFRVVMSGLRSLGLVDFAKLNKRRYDQTGWYTLNYDHEWLKPLLQPSGEQQSDLAMDSNPICQRSGLESGTETTCPENTSKISSPLTPQGEAEEIKNQPDPEVQETTRYADFKLPALREKPKATGKGQGSAAANDDEQKIKWLMDKAETLPRPIAAENAERWAKSQLRGNWEKWADQWKLDNKAHPNSNVLTADVEEIKPTKPPHSFREMLKGLSDKRAMQKQQGTNKDETL